MATYRLRGKAFATKDLERIAFECLDGYTHVDNICHRSALMRYQLHSGNRFPPAVQNIILKYMKEFEQERLE